MNTATLSTQERYERHIQLSKERAARAAANHQISVPVPQVIERIASPVIAPSYSAIHAPVAADDVHVGRVKGASFDVLQRWGYAGLKQACDDLYVVLALACTPVSLGGRGLADLTNIELQDMAEKYHDRRIDSSWISARIAELLLAKRILRRPERRLCSVSKSGIHAFAHYVVPKQVRLVD